MRSRGIYGLLAIAASVAATLVLAGPAAASNLYCGETLTSSVTLIGNLDCSGTSDVALYIGHDGVTLNLNGFWVKGATGSNTIDNESSVGTTIKNGTVYASGGVDAISNDNGGGDNLTVDVVNIVGDKSGALYGVDSENSSGLSVVDSSFSGLSRAVNLSYETGDLIKNNTIETCSTGTCSDWYGVNGSHLTGVTIIGNAFTSDAPQTGTAYYAHYDAGTLFTGNTVTGLEYGVATGNNQAYAYDAGLVITDNVFGGADPADGLVYGVYLDGHDHGDLIAGNFIRNSFAEGVSDWGSFNNTYVGNIATANGRASDDYSFDIEPCGYGPVTMVNNIARLGYSAGFYIAGAYTDSVSGPPYSYYAGNSAIANGTDGSPGFWDTGCAEIEQPVGGIRNQPQQRLPYGSVGATWTGNVAKYNAADGFEFDLPWREIINANLSSQNGDDGFLFLFVMADAQPLAVTNNSATYNGGYGFSGWDDEGESPAFPVPGSGNTGGGTNGIADCYLVAGCS